MNIDYIQSEIDRYRQLIADDEKKTALIQRNIDYHKKHLKIAEKCLKDLQNANSPADTTKG